MALVVSGTGDEMIIDKIVNSVFRSNTYIISNKLNPYCWLVDIGDVEPVLSIVNDRTVRGVFITHSHYDHIYGILPLLEKYPDCMIYTSAEGKEGLLSDKFNFSRYHGDPISYKGNNISVLEDGDSVELFEDIVITAMLTPGHDKSCITYYTDKELFTGDSYIPGIEVFTSFPRSNKADSEISLTKIYKLFESRKIYPGHQ